MKAVQIMRHAVLQVTGNLPEAIRISLPAIVAHLVFLLIQTYGLTPIDPRNPDLAAMAQNGTRTLVAALFSLIFSYWTLVAWHRFVLLQERPASILPQWNGGRVLNYFGKSLLIGLALIGALLVPFVVVSTLGAGSGGVGGVGGGGGGVGVGGAPEFGAPLILGLVALGVLAGFLSLRIMCVLAGTATDRPLGLVAGWRATSNDTATFWILTALCAVLYGILLLLMAVLNLIPGLGLVVELGAYWVQLMVGASLVTTLYGHYIDGRELRA